MRIWGAMSPLASSQELPAFVVLGNPGSRRVELFQAALRGLGLTPARVLAYADLLAGRLNLAEALPPNAVLRIESPGKDFAVECALLAVGAAAAEAEGCAYLSPAAIACLHFDKGLILPSRQWYLGFCATLALIEQQLAESVPPRLMAWPADIALMFDKVACHQRLAQHGMPVPRSLGPVSCFAELIAVMQQQHCPRVFVKLAHGSSASGVVAYQISADRHHATTTVEMVQRDGVVQLYNSRRLRVYREWREIATLINALCQHRVHVEQWLPKAGVAGRTFDLRMMMIAGHVRHTVVRLSQGPMTNLHLLNARGQLADLLALMDAAAWDAACRSCEAAMACFPASLHAGIDLLISPGYRRHAILEVNAFGDLLPGVFWQGMDTYTAEIVATLGALPVEQAQVVSP